MAKIRSKRRSYRRGGIRGRKIPLAIVGGFIPGIAWSAEAATAGNWGGAGQRLLAAYTGYEWAYKKFTPMYLNYGLFPVLGGLVIHSIANWVGINRMLGRTGLPIEV